MTTTKPVGSETKPFPDCLTDDLKVIRGDDDNAYVTIDTQGNPYVVQVGAGEANNLIREQGRQWGKKMRNRDLNEANEVLISHAQSLTTTVPVWNRTAPLPGGGVEIDKGDAEQTRFRVTAQGVETITSGSENLFVRSSVALPFVTPSNTPQLGLLDSHLNLPAEQKRLLVGYITYTLAHPKMDGSKFVHLIVHGAQGSGKTAFSKNIVQALIDPSRVGLQVFPKDQVNLAITCQGSHLNAFDNMRDLSQASSDLLCTLATRGTVVSRKLYTNAEKCVITIHGPALFNGIHEFVRESDLAQRCLTLKLQRIDEALRKPDVELMQALAKDMPDIFAGVLELISKIFAQLPNAVVTHRERMIEFCTWLAAMELVDNAPSGAYQGQYSVLIAEGQFDSIMDNPLVVAITALVTTMQGKAWKGTPTSLLKEISKEAFRPTDRFSGVPSSPIALAKRLKALEVPLAGLGITVTSTRGVERLITIQGSAPSAESGAFMAELEGDF